MISAMLAAFTLSAVAPPCEPSQQSATVGAMSRDRGQRRTGTVTRSGLTPGPVAIAEGDRLCVGEIVTNPRASGLRVAITLAGGREVPLPPGSQFSIPGLDWFGSVAAQIAHFNRLFSPDAYDPGGVRGGGENGAELMVRAIPSWGPMPISWRASEADAGAWSVQLIAGGRTLVGDVTRTFAVVELSSACASGCVIEVRGRQGRVVLRLHVRPATPADIPMPSWLEHGRYGPTERALIGAWLANRLGDPVWEDQGHALLWNASCQYPAAYALLVHDLAGSVPSEPCKTRPLAMRPA
jgi:hypothetical protein